MSLAGQATLFVGIESNPQLEGFAAAIYKRCACQEVQQGVTPVCRFHDNGLVDDGSFNFKPHCTLFKVIRS